MVARSRACARKAIKPYLVLDGGIDCEKTGGPAKQIERRRRTKSGPIDPSAPFEHEYPGKAGLFWVRHEHIGGLGAFAARSAVAKVEPARWVAW